MRALAAISLQAGQSLWRSRSFDPLDHRDAHTINGQRQMMTWKKCIALLASATRRRAIATALMYGLSLGVRFTSAAGEEVEIPTQALMANDGAQIIHLTLPSETAQPIALYRGWPVGSRGCGAACESLMAVPPTRCSLHP
jgi:hypothetical protein